MVIKATLDSFRRTEERYVGILFALAASGRSIIRAHQMEVIVDTSDMRELLVGYLGELDWSGGISKDDVMVHLAGRDEALRTMVNQYVVEETYQSADAILNLIPVQAWQDAQGDTWRGSDAQLAEDIPSNFQAGTEQFAGAIGQLKGSGFGDVGSNAGEVDPGVSLSGEITTDLAT